MEPTLTTHARLPSILKFIQILPPPPRPFPATTGGVDRTLVDRTFGRTLATTLTAPHFPASMKAGLDALPDDVLLALIKACGRHTPDAGGMPDLQVPSPEEVRGSGVVRGVERGPASVLSGPGNPNLTLTPSPSPNPEAGVTPAVCLLCRRWMAWLGSGCPG